MDSRWNANSVSSPTAWKLKHNIDSQRNCGVRATQGYKRSSPGGQKGPRVTKLSLGAILFINCNRKWSWVGRLPTHPKQNPRPFKKLWQTLTNTERDSTIWASQKTRNIIKSIKQLDKIAPWRTEGSRTASSQKPSLNCGKSARRAHTLHTCWSHKRFSVTQLKQTIRVETVRKI